MLKNRRLKELSLAFSDFQQHYINHCTFLVSVKLSAENDILYNQSVFSYIVVVHNLLKLSLIFKMYANTNSQHTSWVTSWVISLVLLGNLLDCFFNYL